MSDDLQIVLVKGRTPVFSEVVKTVTDGPYSHANVRRKSTGQVWEAEFSGFDRFDSLAVNNAGCTCDLFEYDEPLSAAECAKAFAWCDSMRGAGYDTPMLLGFLQRLNMEPPASRKLLFCSEAVMLMSLNLGEPRVLLRNIEAWKVPPNFLKMSTRIHWAGSVVA